VNAPSCSGGCGTVFELSPPSAPGGNWVETVVYFFQGSPDGRQPLGGVIFDQAGNLYGTTNLDGYGLGIVFELSPPSEQGGPWSETILTRFGGDQAGGKPAAGLTLDVDGILFGTATFGGKYGQGTVFRLKPPSVSGGVWSLGDVHDFADSGGEPLAAMTLDNSNTLYGTFAGGGGGVFQITNTGDTATYELLYSFAADGSPRAGLTLYKGALYGTTNAGGYNLNGIVFRLSH